MRVINDPGKVLAHWIYTPEEWNRFRRWERSRLGWVRYLISRFQSEKSDRLNEVLITSVGVNVNGRGEVFLNDNCQLRRVHVRESGNLNILEIFYLYRMRQNKTIRIPIPKGQLINAIHVQECLAAREKF